MAVTENATAVLKRTRELLKEEDQWTKGTFRTIREDGTVCRCILGALADSVDQLYPESKNFWDMKEYEDATGCREARDRLNNAVDKITGRKRMIVTWNDDPSTTHQMILQALDEAIGADDAE